MAYTIDADTLPEEEMDNCLVAVGTSYLECRCLADGARPALCNQLQKCTTYVVKSDRRIL
ncbi:hypothetical protein LY76DRAFT_598112 [Colletotrichum caudatum]|nr:hypothetical protein LY76DRAFT_598112 [Colletotrichum caudatum]